MFPARLALVTVAAFSLCAEGGLTTGVLPIDPVAALAKYQSPPTRGSYGVASPKGAEMEQSLGGRRSELGQLALGPHFAPEVSTNHLPPVIQYIEWAIELPGVTPADPSLTNQVLMRAWQDPPGSVRLEYLTEAGKTYEVQTCRWLNGPWMAFMRFTADKSDITTGFFKIDPCEPKRFFRIRAN